MTTLTLDTTALQANYRLLKSKSAAECAAVVKANAYGLGLERVAPALAQAGCQTFFVAHTQEGVQLRELLRDVRIIVLHGAHEPKLLKEYNLIPCLNGPQDLHWSGPSWLHVDTGMSRLGFPASEIPGSIAPLGLMSHLACSDEPHHPMNAQQLRAFRAVRGRYASLPASLANSSGIFLGQAYYFDLLRPGVALYGVNPTPDAPNPMQPVVQLRARVLQVQPVPEGTPVGYGASWQSERPSRLATIEAGYADGLHRALGPRGQAVLHGVRVPIAGRISMDLIVLDVTDAPPVQVGDEVELIGNSLSIDDVASAADMIGYEVLTSLRPRA